MTDERDWSLVSAQRALLAVAVAALSAIVNYGDELTSWTDVLVWLVVFLPVGYLVLTALAALTSGRWE